MANLTSSDLADSLLEELDQHLTAVRKTIDTLLAEIEEHRKTGAKLAELIRALPALGPELPAVAYRSQWDADAMAVKTDCGPACVAMLLGYRGTSIAIDRISEYLGMGASKKYTTAGDLQRAAKNWGLALEIVSGWTLEQFVSRAPCILLIHYGTIPDRMDANYLGGHWIVLLGVRRNEAVYHDPDWWGNSRDLGAGRVVDTVKLAQAMRDCMLDGNSQGMGLVMTVPKIEAEKITGWFAGR